MLFKISDDSCFLALIDPDAYDGFVGTDWTWDTLQDHFAREAREQHLVVWSTGMEHVWSVDVLFEPVELTGIREVNGSIIASQGRLLLTNYESLTMAAQFADVRLPEAHEQDQILSVSPGTYNCRIIQLPDPGSDAPFGEAANFICTLTPG